MLWRSSYIQAISIHAPLRERPNLLPFIQNKDNISIHAPLRERLSNKVASCFIVRFQSTLPCGSDLAEPSRLYLPVHFNPRSLAGATIVTKPNLKISSISIHAPLRERPFGIVYTSKARPFQSTLPCGSDRRSIIPWR